MKKILIILVSLLLLTPAFSTQKIKVGGYYFPPFIELTYEKNSASAEGLTVDFIKLLNKSQNKYNFELYLTSPKRRYNDFKLQKYDMMIFESKEWGWQKENVNESIVFLNDSEIFITVEGKNDYLDNITNYRIGSIMGYHYNLFKKQDAREYAKNNGIKIQENTTHLGNIYKLLSDRIDIAIITESYLKKFIYENPIYKEIIIISKEKDQVYNHKILARENVDIDFINKVLKSLLNNGELKTLLKKYGI